jgi:hypothetical protein
MISRKPDEHGDDNKFALGLGRESYRSVILMIEVTCTDAKLMQLSGFFFVSKDSGRVAVAKLMHCAAKSLKYWHSPLVASCRTANRERTGAVRQIHLRLNWRHTWTQSLYCHHAAVHIYAS